MIPALDKIPNVVHGPSAGLTMGPIRVTIIASPPIRFRIKRAGGLDNPHLDRRPAVVLAFNRRQLSAFRHDTFVELRVRYVVGRSVS